MVVSLPNEVTSLLVDWGSGNQAALGNLIPLVMPVGVFGRLFTQSLQ
jgi:hypothetical protein